jgi:hypothetical protein
VPALSEWLLGAVSLAMLAIAVQGMRRSLAVAGPESRGR